MYILRKSYIIKKIFAENPGVVKSEKHAIFYEILCINLGEQGKVAEATKELKTAHFLDPLLGRKI
ncbi:MAG: hypothetical protein QMD06_01395 [Candidatus Altarchaeum sp.]|nr:hypothetical protein [Candidatus Altarchaeum sp.]